MSDQKEKQKTDKGYEIPVPKRDDVFDVFKKAATPKKESSTRSPKKKALEK